MSSNFDKSSFEKERGMTEGNDYMIVSIDRRTFESVCINELRMLLQPLREVAIMARVMLPGEARPSFVENAMVELETRREDDDVEDDFWESEEDELLKMTASSGDEESLQGERAWQLLQAMDVKSQKKAQQRGRKMARNIDKRERSFRKQKQAAAEDASMASLLVKRPGGNEASQYSSLAATMTSSVTGNERVQDGIHGRPLSRVILVGGATRMPVIAKLLEAVVGVVPQGTVNPDEAVALGCAVQVGILDGENDGLLGGAQAVLSPIQAAVMRALAIKKRRCTNSLVTAGTSGMLTTSEPGKGEMGKKMSDGLGGMFAVDEFDDEGDFY